MKPLHIMLSKTSTYLKSYDGQSKWKYSLIEEDNLFKKIIFIGIKSAHILKKNLIANLHIIKSF